MPRKKDEIKVYMDKAKASGKYMLALWYMDGENVILYRKTQDFLLRDVPVALTQLEADLRQHGILLDYNEPSEEG